MMYHSVDDILYFRSWLDYVFADNEHLYFCYIYKMPFPMLIIVQFSFSFQEE